MGTARALHSARRTRRDAPPKRTADGRGRALASSLRLQTQEEGERAGRGHQPEALRLFVDPPIYSQNTETGCAQLGKSPGGRGAGSRASCRLSWAVKALCSARPSGL